MLHEHGPGLNYLLPLSLFADEPSEISFRRIVLRITRSVSGWNREEGEVENPKGGEGRKGGSDLTGLQGDHSGCSLSVLDMTSKQRLYKEHILKCFDVNQT